MSASSEAPIPLAGVAGFNRNQWQLSIGISGNLRLESVAGFDRNQWQPSRGIRTPVGEESPGDADLGLVASHDATEAIGPIR
jgi:hypothetical protein